MYPAPGLLYLCSLATSTACQLPWRTEFEAYGNPKDKRNIARSWTTWRGVANILQSRLPDHGVNRQSTIRVVTLKPDRPPRENIELDELMIPASALIRGETSLKSKSAAYEPAQT